MLLFRDFWKVANVFSEEFWQSVRVLRAIPIFECCRRSRVVQTACGRQDLVSASDWSDHDASRLSTPA